MIRMKLIEGLDGFSSSHLGRILVGFSAVDLYDLMFWCQAVKFFFAYPETASFVLSHTDPIQWAPWKSKTISPFHLFTEVPAVTD